MKHCAYNIRWQTILIFSIALCLYGPILLSCRSQTTTNLSETSLQITEITLERTYSGCTDCRAYRIVISNHSTPLVDTVSVTFTNLKTNQTQEGNLPRSTFEQLSKLIERQRYFELSNAYGEAVMDSVSVTTSVSKNGVRKTVIDKAEMGPIELWGIEMAIEGAVANVNWQVATK